MRKLWVIAWKELYTTLRDRNLILIMFATPLLLSTIIGLAFGGLGGDSPTIGTIEVAVVNLDEGVTLSSLFSGTVGSTSPISNAAITDSGTLTGLPTDFTLNTGTIVASILLGEPITATGMISGTGLAGDNGAACPLVAASSGDDANNTTQGSLDELIHATSLTDTTAARQGVEQGDYAAAVLIPPGFTQTLLPSFGLIDNSDLANRPQVEVYGNRGDALAAGIVNSIVNGIVSQFERLPVTLEAALETLLNTVDLNQIDLDVLTATLDELRTAATTGDFPALSTNLTGTSTGTATITDTFAILGCLFTPGINPVSLVQQPLDQLQEGSTFGRVLVIFGSAQAVFFALFTGVFGILSIYEERKQWTLQRMLASPTGGTTILLGKLLGNLIVVIVQLLVLMVALTVVATIASGTPTLIWGNNLGLLLVVVVLVSLAVSGIGVLIVGLARTPEQVQIFGPMVNMTLGVLGGAFGFSLPEPLPNLSLIYWGTSAFEKLAGGQLDIGVNLLVLAAQGLLFFIAGAWLFRRRLNL
jgi:ABC-type transport system involved in multi-copper enzyme maturation permease subunit